MNAEQILQLVITTFGKLGATDPHNVIRTFRLVDRRFIGQRFRCSDFEATLSADASQIEFFNAAGQSVRKARLADLLKTEAA